MRLSEAEAWQALAEIALADGRSRDCRRYARKALRLFERRGSVVGTLLVRGPAAHHDPTAAYLGRGACGADPCPRRPARPGGPAGPVDPAPPAGRPGPGRRAGFVTEAAALAQTSGSGHRTPCSTRLLARQLRALIAGARGERGPARAQIRAGLPALTPAPVRLGSFDLQTAVVRHGASLARMGLADAIARPGGRAAALRWLERTRALTNRLAPVRPPEDPRMAGLLEELRHLRLELRQQEVSGHRDLAAAGSAAGVLPRPWSARPRPASASWSGRVT